MGRSDRGAWATGQWQMAARCVQKGQSSTTDCRNPLGHPTTFLFSLRDAMSWFGKRRGAQCKAKLHPSFGPASQYPFFRRMWLPLLRTSCSFFPFHFVRAFLSAIRPVLVSHPPRLRRARLARQVQSTCQSRVPPSQPSPVAPVIAGSSTFFRPLPPMNPFVFFLSSFPTASPSSGKHTTEPHDDSAQTERTLDTRAARTGDALPRNKSK